MPYKIINIKTPVTIYLQRVSELIPLVWLRHGQLLPHVIDPDLALVIPGGHVEAALGPGHSVESRPALHHHAGAGNLRVLVEVPEVEPPGAVHCREQGRVLRGPGTVVNIVT